MNWGLYVRGDKVIVPTTAKAEAGYYLEVEPVEVVAKGDGPGIEKALLFAIARGNARVPTPSREVLNRPVVPKHVGLKSYYAFERTAEAWHLSEDAGHWKVEYMPREKSGKGWVFDSKLAEVLPAGSDAVVASRRLVELIQTGCRPSGAGS